MVGEVFSQIPPEPTPGVPVHLRMSRQRFEQARHELMVELHKIRRQHQLTHVEGLGLLAAAAAVYIGDYYNFVAAATAAAQQQDAIAMDGNVAAAAQVAAAKATAEAALRKG